MIPTPNLSFVQCEQTKFRPKQNVKMKVSHSVMAVGIVAGGGGGGTGRRGWEGWRNHVMSHMT